VDQLNKAAQQAGAALLVGVCFFAFFPEGLATTHSREVIGFEKKPDGVALLKNIAIPNASSNDFSGLKWEGDVYQLAMYCPKHISLPLLNERMSLPVIDIPSVEGIQFSFSANSRGYGADGCWSFAVVVYRNYEKLLLSGSVT
jgi:hypothetical protein